MQENPAFLKTFVCLANSRKLTGRCIAGCLYDMPPWEPVEWIRPVSDRPHREVSERERQYEDGRDPQVLDVIRVPLISAQPNGCQQENWILDPNFYWEKKGIVALDDLAEYAMPSGRLWLNGSSTYNGSNDRMLETQTANLPDSLKLIYVHSVQVVVFKPGADFGNNKRRVQARFLFDGVSSVR